MDYAEFKKKLHESEGLCVGFKMSPLRSMRALKLRGIPQLQIVQGFELGLEFEKRPLVAQTFVILDELQEPKKRHF